VWEKKRLSSVLSWLSAGYLVSALGGLISLLPLTLEQLTHLSPQVGARWRELAALINEPLEVSLTLTPVETWTWLTLELSCVVVAYVAAHTHRDRRPILSALALIGPLLTLLGALHAVLGLEAVYGLYQSLDREALRGFVTPMINLNHAASLMSLSALVSLGLGLHTLKTTQKESRQSTLSAKVWLGGALISALGVMISGSRAASVALFFGVIVSMRRAIKRGLNLNRSLKRGLSRELNPLWTALAVLSFTVLLLSTLLWGGWAQFSALIISSESDGSFLSDPNAYPRLSVWRDTILYIKDHALWGSGRGSFGEVFTSYQQFATRLWASSPESHPLQQLTEGGFLGLIGGVALPLIGWRVWWRRSRGEAHETAFGLWVGLGVVGAHQLVDFGFEYAGLSVPVAVAWGLLWSYLPIKERLLKKRTLMFQPTKLALIVLLLLLGVSVWKQQSSAAWRLRPLSQELSALVPQLHQRADNHEFESVLTSALKHHPASAHLGLYGALSRADELFKSAQIQDPQGKEHEALSALEQELSAWLKYTRARARYLSSLSQLEARLLRAQGFPELAALSYHRALQEAPWRFKELASELIETGAWSLQLLTPSVRAPFVRLVRDQQGVEAMLEALQKELTSAPELIVNKNRAREREAIALRRLALIYCGQRAYRAQEACRSLMGIFAQRLKQSLRSQEATRITDELWWSRRLDAEGAELLVRYSSESPQSLESLEHLESLLENKKIEDSERELLSALVKKWRRGLRLWSQHEVR
jgi:hypothetical protein